MGSACTGSGPDERLHSTDYDSLTISKSTRNAVRILDFFRRTCFLCMEVLDIPALFKILGWRLRMAFYILLFRFLTFFENCSWFRSTGCLFRRRLLFPSFIIMRCNHAIIVSFNVRNDISVFDYYSPRAGDSWID